MKAKNINDDNLEINEENYAAYERLMEDYISLTKHPDSKYNLDNNAENFFDKLIFIPITTLIGLVATTSFESPIPFILVSATGISTMIYSLVKYDTIGKNLKQELKKRHPNIDTDVDFQELDRDQLKILFNKLIEKIVIYEFAVPGEKEVCLNITINMRIPGYTPKYALQFVSDLKSLDKKEKSNQKNFGSKLDGGERGIFSNTLFGQWYIE